MSARGDMLDVARALATQAKSSAGDGSVTGAEIAAGLASGAKAALEAAALVDADPAPLVAALERLDRRVPIGTAETLEVGGPAAAIDLAADVIEDLQVEVAVNGAAAAGYTELRSLLLNLQQTFTKSGTDTSLRIAARIHGALEDAQRAVDAAATTTETKEMAHG